MALSPLHHRMKEVIGPRSFREVAKITNTNHETVRRYMQGQTPSVEFLTALCDALRVNTTWMLLGQGPMRSSDTRAHVLKEANAHELLGAIAETLEALAARVERIELYVHTIETRLRAAQTRTEPASHDTPHATQALNSHSSAVRPAHIADALPQRPRPQSP